MRRAWRLQRTGRGPDSRRWIVEINQSHGSIRVEAARGDYPAIGQQRQGERPPLMAHRTCGRPDPRRWIVKFGRPIGVKRGIHSSSGDEDFSIWKPDCGSPEAQIMH